MEPKNIRSGRMGVAPKVEAPNLTRDELKAKMERERDRDAEEVVGIFQNLESKGGTARFNLKLHAGEEFLGYELTDGERYRLPRGVARHLNNNCFYYEYKHINGQTGEAGMRNGLITDGRLKSPQDMQVSTKVHRYAFRSLEFMDDDLEMYPSNIIKVEKV